MILAASMIAATPLLAEPAADGNYWRSMVSGTTRTLHQISAVSKDFAVAAGTHGTLLVYSGGAWSPVPDWASNNPYTVDSSQLYVTALSPTNVWVGAFGSTAYSNLTNWNSTSFTTRTTGIGARIGYMANVDGILLAARGENRVSISLNSMAPTPAITTVQLPDATKNQVVISVAGSSANNLWAANQYETFRSTNSGANWTKIGAPTLEEGETLRAMAVSSNETTWLGTNSGRVFSWTESNDFSAALLDFDFFIRDIYARDDQNVWFVGDGGNAWYYNGITASQIDLGTTSAFYSITGTDDSIWISGANGTIYQAVPEPSTVAITMLGVCCFAGYRFLRLK